MVLPLFIVGSVGAGAATGLAVGSVSAIAAYSAQGKVLNRYLAHLLTYEVPKNVTAWSFRDFLRIAGPLVAPRLVMFSTSVALMGFVSTKMDIPKDEK
ncbi:hypothetical protein BBJ29_001986 [Phytophthora kernoviae]|uniref:Uncharacterized protein n=1 Tax=Phytophthora kernoviae TaxID=325452 RepID=A0A3F2RRB3_9STRA|nr:hypothetical protein BBP00_00004574 [Phytophthora kernoviae]RLN67585.1 hypothetical protein BBJ29_001986 [Phytophthora kernoviae]